MIRFGVVGAGSTADEFVRSGKLHPEFTLTAVCARTIEDAEAFAAIHGISRVFACVEDMAESRMFDGVFIASAQELHGRHTMQFLQRGIPVLCEHVMGVSAAETAALIDCAHRQDILLMQGFKYPLTSQFQTLTEYLPQLGQVRHITASHCRYLPQYDNFRNGIVEHPFMPGPGSGAMTELGVQLVYSLVMLYGPPTGIKAGALLLPNGVDGSGMIVAQYPEMLVSLTFSIIADSLLPIEFQGENGSLMVSLPKNPPLMRLALTGGEAQDIPIHQINYNLYYQIAEFIALLDGGRTQSSVNTHRNDLRMMAVVDEYRRQIGQEVPEGNLGAFAEQS